MLTCNWVELLESRDNLWWYRCFQFIELDHHPKVDQSHVCQTMIVLDVDPFSDLLCQYRPSLSWICQEANSVCLYSTILVPKPLVQPENLYRCRSHSNCFSYVQNRHVDISLRSHLSILNTLSAEYLVALQASKPIPRWRFSCLRVFGDMTIYPRCSRLTSVCIWFCLCIFSRIYNHLSFGFEINLPLEVDFQQLYGLILFTLFCNWDCWLGILRNQPISNAESEEQSFGR